MVFPGAGRPRYVFCGRSHAPTRCSSRSNKSAHPPPGGANPAIRTLFYRLVRLLSLTITPVFVFDGPQKPAFKRHRRSRGTPGDTVSAAMAKRLIRLFGFAAHDAPGEAEAECALLQRRGVVDAVLSEDVDTIMFGCARTLRAWTPEPGRGTTPTHVSVYDVADLRLGGGGGDSSGSGPALDREGMVLVALMSGGDYLPEGVPGCGVKVACEAARAGFGRRLCRIKRADAGALRAWREDLARELRTNEGGFFRVRHRALTIPEDFPDVEVLRYYTHPVVSQDVAVERLRGEMAAKREIDISGLRAFTAETFDWTYKVGAFKFIRVFAPSLLVQALMNLSRQDLASDDPEAREEVESRLVRSIKSRRTHFSTDETPELRIVHIPNDIVGVDLDAEEDEVITSTSGRSGLALNSDDEGEDLAQDEEDQSKSGPKKVFDPLQPDLAWVPETVAKLGVPLTVEDWEGKQRAKRVAKDKRAGLARRPPKKASGMPAGALDRFVKTTKPDSMMPMEKRDPPAFLLSSSPPVSSTLPSSQQLRQEDTWSAPRESEGFPSEPAARKQSKSSKTSRTKTKATVSRPPLDVNPWSIASSQVTPNATRTQSTSSAKEIETILISSSPLVAPSPPPATAPAATDAIAELESQSPVPFPDNDNSRSVASSRDPFSPGSRSPPFRSTAEEDPIPRKHNRSSGEATVKPAAKRSQRSSRATATLAARDGSPPRRSARTTRAAAQKRAAQPSIKSFGRLNESMGKMDAAPTAKGSGLEAGSDDEDEDELEDLRALGATRPSKDAERVVPSCNRRPASRHIEARREYEEGNGSGDEHRSLPALEKKKVTAAPTTVVAVIEIPSSPPVAASTSPSALATISPFQSTPHKTRGDNNGNSNKKKKATRLYIPRKSDAGLGYFREVEVSPEEADRLLREEEARCVRECLRGRRPGGRRMWRESEVSILDLTGED